MMTSMPDKILADRFLRAHGITECSRDPTACRLCAQRILNTYAINRETKAIHPRIGKGNFMTSDPKVATITPM